MKQLGVGIIAIALAASLWAGGMSSSYEPVSSTLAKSQDNPTVEWTPLPRQNKKVEINDDYYFKYSFSEKPKMGTFVLKIQVFDKSNDQVVPYTILGRSDMPSMRGAHDSGDVEFKLNKNNDYLLPVSVVMPGEWEIRVTFILDDKPVFHGSIQFDV